MHRNTRTVVFLAAILCLTVLFACCGCGKKPAAKSAAAGGPAASGGAAPTECMPNCKVIVLAALAYAQDHNETMPTTTDPAAFEKDVAPYAKNLSLVCPETGKAYKLNPAVSGKSLNACMNDVFLTDTAPHASGRVTSCLVSGVCKQVNP
jgi:hypothetical protein